MELSGIFGGRMSLSISFTRTFTKNGSKLTGRKEEIESGGLIGLETRIMVENLHRIGSKASLKTELLIWDR